MGRKNIIMSKIKKRFFALMLSMGIITSSFFAVFAATTSFTNLSVPRNQAMQYLSVVSKSTSSNYGYANISKLTADAVTFSVRGLGDDFGPGTVCNGTGQWRVSYSKTYPSGKSMQARFRNHNWTNATRTISGNFDYK